MRKQDFAGYTTAIGCSIIVFINMGISVTTGVFQTDIIRDLGCNYTLVSFAPTISCMFAFVGSILAFKIIEKLTPRWTLLLGSILCAVQMLCFYGAQDVWALYMGSVFGGLASGIAAEVCCAALISEWFIKRRATMIGVVIAFETFGGAAFIFLSGLLLTVYNWRTIYLIYAIFSICFGVIINLLLVRLPEKLGQKPLGLDEKDVLNEHKPEINVKSIDFKNAKKTSSFWLMIVGVICASMTIASVKVFGVSFWKDFGVEPLVASEYLSILILIGSTFAILFGGIVDRFGLKIAFAFILLPFAIGMLGFIIWASELSAWLNIISIVMVALAVPVGSISSVSISRIFGPKDFTKINSFMMAAYYAGCGACLLIFGAIRDAAGSFVTGWILLSIIALIAYLCLLVATSKAPKLELEI